MRIVAGRFKGRHLVAPRDGATRPTSEKVREAVFSMLGDVGGLAVLDAFAGTGALGLEALSRGAARVVFVESRRPALTALSDNLATVGATAPEATTIPRPVERAHDAVAPHGPFDLIFADPPWAMIDGGEAPRALGVLLAAPVASDDAVLVLEHASRSAAPEVAGFSVDETRRWGDTAATFYRRLAAPGTDG
jgi:16S rRNA (guanine(966)-N(2))-methyltransferase RsmD